MNQNLNLFFSISIFLKKEKCNYIKNLLSIINENEYKRENNNILFQKKP